MDNSQGATLFNHLETFLSVANKKVAELKDENNILKRKKENIKNTEVQCGNCKNNYSLFENILHPAHVKIKNQPCVMELKFESTEALVSYVKALPHMKIDNLDKFLGKYNG
uniref:C2H2-type domain-containing protein n=1 Tax=Parastrongyloides trichosuri TaxID=131310 RepID=A0A0N4ZUQ9_PARTI